MAKKLGIKDSMRIAVLHAPQELDQWLGDLPSDVEFRSDLRAGSLDIVMIFAVQRSKLESEITRAEARIQSDGMIWCCWPKKASKVPTDITEEIVREIALAGRLVDVKVCAVSEVWSGLKLVIRKELR
ncbi:MAG: DUF3052 family protein [Phycisphaerales bacterium]|nr:DUF3052 family protein [Phycisphaerales bacterium]